MKYSSFKKNKTVICHDFSSISGERRMTGVCLITRELAQAQNQTKSTVLFLII